MLFSRFAFYLQEIENLPGRLAMTEALARLFKEAESSEADKLCYLCLGRLGPKYSALDLQLAEKMMIRVVAQVVNRPVTEITAAYREVGDLGETYFRIQNSGVRSQNGRGTESTENMGAQKVQEREGEKTGVPPLLKLRSYAAKGFADGARAGRSQMAEERREVKSVVIPHQANNQDVGSSDLLTDSMETTSSSSDPASRLLRVACGMTIPSVSQVYEHLLTIAKQSGAGSQERKLNLMAQLLKSVDPLSGKYLVRFPLKKLRLGFSELTILDALSWSVVGDKSLRVVLETAFNVRADIGAIARLFLEQGIEGVQTIMPRPGTPILPARATPLMDPEEILEKMDNQAIIEPKFDGFRVQIHIDHGQDFSVQDATEIGLFDTPQTLPVQIFSRNLENITEMFPELVEAAAALPVQSAILDGEALATDPRTGKLLDFQETIKRKRKYGIETMSQSAPLKAFLFDLLYLNGESWISKPLIERAAQLKNIIPFPQRDPIAPPTAGLQVFDSEAQTRGDDVDWGVLKHTLTIADQQVVTTVPELIEYFDKQAGVGLEGIMAKKPEAPYRAGARDFTWVKYKVGMQVGLADTIDAVVMGYFKGKGKWAAFGMGKVLIGIPVKGEIVALSKVGSGFSEESIKEMVERCKPLIVPQKPADYIVDKNLIPDVWLEPKLVIEIRADSVSKSLLYKTGLSLRFPRFIKFRDDKGVDEATSLEELKNMAG